jgi:hypothetical protein
MEHRWNEIDRGKPKYWGKTCPSATLSTTNPTWTDPGSNPGLRGGRLATNRLSHGTAQGPVWTGAENSSPPGFDPRTVQPVGAPLAGTCIEEQRNAYRILVANLKHSEHSLDQDVDGKLIVRRGLESSGSG